MTHHLITADVYAHWGDRSPAYRVYVDGDLLTERDFGWPGHEVFIRENIEVNLLPGVHKLVIEHINGYGSLQVKDIIVNGVKSTAEFITR